MSSRLLRLAVSCNFSDLVINVELYIRFGSSEYVREIIGKDPNEHYSPHVCEVQIKF